MMSKPESPGDVAAFDYHLPEELIATHPLPRRDDSRLLVVDRESQKITNRQMVELPDIFDAGDCLVVNDTQVVPAKLLGTRVSTGGGWDGLYLDSNPQGQWRLIGQTRGHLQPGETISLKPADRSDTPTICQELKLIEQGEGGVWTAELMPPRDTLKVLEQFGTVPLPPYVQRNIASDEDRKRYQTVFARHPGAVAAPTAGLHLSEDLLANCRHSGLGLEHVTLHVGLGTFRPIAAQQLDQHVMHSEWCRLTESTSRTLNKVQESGHRVVAVGTTVVRTLETAIANGQLAPFEGTTDLFIRPGHEFQSFDALLTNFHLPRSTLFVLICAICGIDLAKFAYKTAVANNYRFYSYGDAMLIL